MKDHIRKIKIFDTTLRDGDQSPGFSLNKKEKIEFAALLEEMQVDIIEAGFPAASEEDYSAVETIAKKSHYAEIAAICRCKETEIDHTVKAIEKAKRPRVNIYIPTSQKLLTHKMKMSEEKVLECIDNCIRHAKKQIDEVQFTAEDATRTDDLFLQKVIQIAISAGATTICVPDTVGYLMPTEAKKWTNNLIGQVKSLSQVSLAVHCHNDLGMAVANSLSSVEAGACQVECTILGIGERGGNAALEEVVMGLHTRSKYFNVSSNIQTKLLSRAGNMLSIFTKQPIPLNKPIVGGNAFVHASGGHQEGVLSDPSTYEIMDPEEVGFTEPRIVLTRHSGRKAVLYCLMKQGIHYHGDFSTFFHAFKELATKEGKVGEKALRELYYSFSHQIDRFGT